MNNKFSLSSFEDATLARKLLKDIEKRVKKPLSIMEVCGTHTRSIYKYGIDKLLPENIKLISGPGCPVCVTPRNYIDKAINLSENENVIIATFGDLIRVPGSNNKTLSLQRALGGKISIIYSPMDCLNLAENNRDREIVFLAVGFETTAPAIALMLKVAKEKNMKNLFVLLALKTMPRAMEELILDKDIKVNGFMCPGHVSTIIGTEKFNSLAEKYRIPMAVCGFEALDILGGLLSIIEDIDHDEYKCRNRYTRAVRDLGNLSAMKVIEEVFQCSSSTWRGLGEIMNSGYKLRDKYEDFNVERKYLFTETVEKNQVPGCICGEILKGKKEPKDCKLYGEICTPQCPVGPCMVSSEGTCGIAYTFGE